MTPEQVRDELFIALRRLIVKATEFQRNATLLDELDTTSDPHLTVALSLAQEVVQLACPHREWKGVNLVALTDPAKQWRCTTCQLIQQRPIT